MLTNLGMFRLKLWNMDAAHKNISFLRVFGDTDSGSFWTRAILFKTGGE